MIRVAQRGWNGSMPAETVEDVTAGIGCYWVEIDGVRIERVVRVEVVSDGQEVTVPRLVVDVCDGVQILYVDADGNPLPGDPVSVERIPSTTHQTVLYPQDLFVPEEEIS